MKPIAHSLRPTVGGFRSLVRFSLRPLLSAVHGPRSTVRFSPRSTVYGLRPASAFTLVELMVVVAIISILLMLLIPNIRAVREKAWSSSCQNNLRQYGVAMNQYMADKGGYFIYPGFGYGGVAGKHLSGDSDIGDFGVYDNRAVGGAAVGGASADNWPNFVMTYVRANVTLASLSAGEPSVRVCPVVLRDLHAANYFDPLSPNFKGYRSYLNPYTAELEDSGDFCGESGAGYGDDGNLLPNYALVYLHPWFTTYAINPNWRGWNKKDIPQNVVAFIDWNAKESWGAGLKYTTQKFLFTSPNNSIVQDVTPKWTNAWWLTEVGFHHRIGNEYGANYVAMDGHVGWVSSNKISQASFTNSLISP